MIRDIGIDLLRAFLVVYEARNFSRAAERLGRTQSTISQQIKKLEDLLGYDVLKRSKRSVNLTTQGEILLPYAQKIIAMNDEVFGRISKPDISGTVKLGAPEAFSANHLPNILMQFAKSYPDVALEVECDLSHNLLEKFGQGYFDIALIKRDSKSKIHGNKVWHESLIWAGCEKKTFNKTMPLPLILSPHPCVYRAKVLDTLDKKKIKWKPVFTSSSMTGRIAAAKAGLGVTTIPKEMLAYTHGLISLDEKVGLPKLPSIEIDLITNENNKSDAAERLADHIVFALENNPSIHGDT